MVASTLKIAVKHLVLDAVGHSPPHSNVCVIEAAPTVIDQINPGTRFRV